MGWPAICKSRSVLSNVPQTLSIYRPSSEVTFRISDNTSESVMVKLVWKRDIREGECAEDAGGGE